MRLLILLNSIRVSGTEKLMIALAKRFKSQGDEVYLFPLITPFDETFRKSLTKDDQALNILFPKYIERFDSLIWKLNGLTIRIFNRSIRSYLLQRYVARQCREKNIQLIVSNSYPSDLFALQLSKKTGINYVVVDHGSYCNFLAEGIAFDREPLNHATAVSGVSQWVVEQLKKVLPQSTPKLVYNGHIPLTRNGEQSFQNLINDPDYFVFCMHGRGSEQKGWDIAIRAYEAVRDRGFKVKLLLLTEGPVIDLLRKQYSNDKNLIFGKFVYNLADIFDFVNAGLVLSKKYEAFGLTVLDYFSAGIPVVASNVGGIGEVVKLGNQAGGFLVETDSEGSPLVEEVITKMIELIQHKEIYTSFSSDAKIIADHFSMERCAAGYREIFQSVIE